MVAKQSVAPPKPTRSRSRLSILQLETERLGKLLGNPQAFCQRRVDRLTFTHGSRYQWNVTTEIRIPSLGEDQKLTNGGNTRVVTLGVYDKGRFPDLIVTDAQDCHLAVLGRKERALLLGDLFLREHVPAGLEESDPLIRTIKSLVNLIIFTDQKETARDLARRLNECRRGWKLSLGNSDDFESKLDKLTGSRHLLAYVDAEPGETVVLKHSFSESFVFDEGDPYGRDRLITSLGMLPREIDLPHLNVSQTRSYHLVVEAPEGLCIEDMRWVRPSRPGAECAKDAELRQPFLRGTVVTLSAHKDDVDVCGSQPETSLPPKYVQVFRRRLHSLRESTHPLRRFLLGIEPPPRKRAEQHNDEAEAKRQEANQQDEPRVVKAQFGVQVHPRGLVRFVAALLAALLGAFVTVIWQIDKLRGIQKDGAGAALVAVAALGGLAITYLVPRAAGRLVGGLRWAMVLGSLVAFVGAGLIAFDIAPRWIVLWGAVGSGLALTGILCFLWAAFSIRGPEERATAKTSSEMSDWRSRRVQRAYSRLLLSTLLGVVLAVVLFVLGLHRAG
jgi:hypothetical protein